MAYYKPTILQLFQTDLEEGTTTFQRAEESMSVNKLTGSRQTDGELTVLYSISKLLTPYTRLFSLRGSQSAVFMLTARSLQLSSMFAYRWCVNKQLQQLEMNHSYWLYKKCFTKIKILELRKSYDKTLVYGFIVLTYLQWPVFGVSKMKSEVNPTAIHVGFVVDKAKNVQAFLRMYHMSNSDHRWIWEFSARRLRGHRSLWR